ncbi:MAG: sugar kinase [Planctomycetia bacterium]|nr:sugar kinase [Planctomycetia bacterium]
MPLVTSFQKVVIVTRKTQLEELIEQHGTRDQAAFILQRRGQSINDVLDSHHRYSQSLAQLKAAIPSQVRQQVIERQFLPNFLFGPHDLIMTLGQDGVVVNTAKYLQQQPILAFNPDPGRIDGVLIPFKLDHVEDAVISALSGKMPHKSITLARAELEDGQTLEAVNDLFIGIQSHASARYQIAFNQKKEEQSSSGIIVSTGAGSTGWYRSILTGAYGISQNSRGALNFQDKYRFAVDARELRFNVREPFISQTSQANLISGRITEKQSLEIVSRMPQHGIIFSDGMEADFLRFDSGMRANIRIADRSVTMFWK